MHRARPFADPADREIAAFCAGALAFGRVASVLNSIDVLFSVMGGRPAEFVRNFDPEAPPPAMRVMVHRWIRGEDLIALLWILRQMLETSGSLENFFLRGYEDGHDDIGPALDSFSTRALALDIRRAYGRVPRRPGVCYFFPRPSAGRRASGSTCSCGGMARSDEVAWGSDHVPVSKLIVPLDTHVIRLGRCLRLTLYVSP